MRSKQLKAEARKQLKVNYFRIVLLCFLVSLFASGNYFYKTAFPKKIPFNEVKITLKKDHAIKSNSDIIDEFFSGIEKTIPKRQPATRGVLAFLVNQISSSSSFLFGILNACNQFLFHGKLASGILILIGALVSFLYWLFIGEVLPIGEIRFFLEKRKYKDTQLGTALFPYRVRKTTRIAEIIFLKNLYTFLWSLTIVGGIIKYYSYEMIPYILAENPTIPRKEAFALSKKMMQGNKWRAFCLDLSFLPLHLLSLFTWGLTNIFITMPYQKATRVEFYMDLRKKARENASDMQAYLCDTYLDGAVETGVYPQGHYLIHGRETRRWLNIDYHKDYSFLHLILLFFNFSIIGWCWEVLLHLFSDGELVNRGTMMGPWLPIYGWGGILLLVLLKRTRDDPWRSFVLAMVLCGIIEYGTAWYLETFKQMKWWDYHGYFLNLHGRICLEGLLVFGLGGCAFIYVIAPLLDNLYQKIKYSIRILLAVLLVGCYLVDFMYSSNHPNQGPGVTEQVFLKVQVTVEE